MTPSYFPLVIQQGATLGVWFALKQPNGTIANPLTTGGGYSIAKLQIRDKSASDSGTVLLELTTANGGITLGALTDANGASQSGYRLVSYINGVQRTEKVFDALMPLVFAGRSAPWIDASPDKPLALSAPQTRIRDDLAAKVFGLDSETEATAYLAMRQPDTDMFRYWEIAGASHGGTEQEARIKLITDRDGVSTPDSGPPIHISDVLWSPTCDAAIGHVHRWINGGEAPPIQPKI